MQLKKRNLFFPEVWLEPTKGCMLGERAASEPRGLLLPLDEIDSLLKVQILTWQMVVWGPAQKEPTQFKIDTALPL